MFFASLERKYGRGRLRLIGRVAVSIFLLWQLFAVVDWNLPYTAPLITTTMPLVRPYMVATGFMQGWAMFAPDPYTLDISVYAHIHYADGTVRSWVFPRMQDMNKWDRYGKERWRKYIEVAHQDEYSFLWPPMGRYAARINNLYPGNPPVSVDLIRTWRTVRAPDESPGNFSSYQFTTVAISPEDLK